MTYKPYIGTEDAFQIAVAKFLDAKGVLWCHAPNGGSRNKAEAGKMKGMGVKAGVPDILIFEPLGSYAGLAIELKVGKNKCSEAQLKWQKELRGKGWQTHVSYSLDEVIDKIDLYFSADKDIIQASKQIMDVMNRDLRNKANTYNPNAIDKNMTRFVPCNCKKKGPYRLGCDGACKF